MDRDGLIHILIGTIEPLGTLRSNKKNWNPRNRFPYGSILEFRGGGGVVILSMLLDQDYLPFRLVELFISKGEIFSEQIIFL
jgi:hypothetical protein